MNTFEDFRKAIGMTQEAMAKELEISKSFYEKIESGERKPGRELIEKIKKKYPLLDVNIFLNLNHTEREINTDKSHNNSITSSNDS